MKGPILLSVLFFIFSCDNKTSTGVYKTTEYKKFNEKDRIIGESVWATSCFRCHLYGSNGASSLEDEEYWSTISGKGLDELFNSCLLYTSPSPRDRTRSRMPSSA